MRTFAVVLIMVLAKDLQGSDFEQIKQIATQWAPLIWMSPEENFYPSSVENFFDNVHLANENEEALMLPINKTHFPQINTKSLYLVTTRNLDTLLNGANSFITGHNPNLDSVPSYVIVTPCVSHKTSYHGKPDPNLYFSISYWTFYPYNKGKNICFIGKVPSLTIFGRCFGHLKTIGSHVGDWEHMTLSFKGHRYPSEMYIAMHDTGGYYKYDKTQQNFKLIGTKSRKGVKVQRPKLPPIVRTQGGHPVLFAAEGSHGLWPAPGEHEFVKIPYLTDRCGYGTPWKTWKNLEIFSVTDSNLPKWIYFKGRWGNPKSNCVLTKKLGLCEYTDGPQGILRANSDFMCWN